MVAFVKSGPDIVKALRDAHPELQVQSKIGVVSSFCKGIRVEKSDHGKVVEIVAMATTDDLDLDGERVLPDGADWSYLLKNRNIFLDHSYSTLNVVGKLRSMTRSGNGWQMRVALLSLTDNECARACAELAAAGGIGASIGFEADDYGPPTAAEALAYPGASTIIRKWRGLEVSLTGMPCNVSCQSLAVSYGEDKSARVRELFAKSRFSEATYKRFGLDSAPAKPRRVIAAYSVAGYSKTALVPDCG